MWTGFFVSSAGWLYGYAYGHPWVPSRPALRFWMAVGLVVVLFVVSALAGVRENKIAKGAK
jgi:hypothetical protein